MDTPASQIATGGYEGFYGLQQCPFDLEPDTRMVFDSESYLTTLDETIRAIRSNTSLIVVTGDIGTGKTLFSRGLTERLTSDVLLFEYAGPPSSTEAFLAKFASELGVVLDGLTSPSELTNDEYLSEQPDLSSGDDEPLAQFVSELGAVPDSSTSPSDTDRRALLARCRDLLQRLPADDTAALIVVDEAHGLPPELLDDIGQLLGFAATYSNRLQIILVGRPELETLFERSEAIQLAQYEMKRLELRPLQYGEIGRYVDRRLWVAQGGATLGHAETSEPGTQDSGRYGNTGELFWRVRFTPSAIRSVAQLSEGVPIWVNLVCDRALQSGLVHRERRIGARQVLAAARDLRLPVPPGLRFTGTGKYFALSALCLTLAVVVWMMIDLNAKGTFDTEISTIDTQVPGADGPQQPAAPVSEMTDALKEADRLPHLGGSIPERDVKEAGH